MDPHHEHRKEFIRELERMAARRDVVTVFGDAVGMMAAALGKVTSPDCDAAEREYRAIADRYTEDELAHVWVMFANVLAALELRRESFLGPILEEIGAAATHNGQFLTPAPLANLMARVNMADYEPVPGKVITLNDPACGAGVTLIAQAEMLMNEKHVPQRDILIIGGDIDKRACDMTFIELSLLGYAARVDHEDALSHKTLSPSRFTFGYVLHGGPARFH